MLLICSYQSAKNIQINLRFAKAVINRKLSNCCNIDQSEICKEIGQRSKCCGYQQRTLDRSQRTDIIRSLQLRRRESTSTFTVLSRCKHVCNKSNISHIYLLCNHAQTPTHSYNREQKRHEAKLSLG